MQNKIFQRKSLDTNKCFVDQGVVEQGVVLCKIDLRFSLHELSNHKTRSCFKIQLLIHISFCLSSQTPQIAFVCGDATYQRSECIPPKKIKS
jgi:hypothetical protein